MWAALFRYTRDMATPTPIGQVHYSEPRAVQIRDRPEDLTHTATAISGTVNIVSETVLDRQKILAGWSEIVEAINMKVHEIVGRAE